MCDGVQESRPGKSLAGDKLSHADLAVFCQMSALQCGWLDGKTCAADRLHAAVEFSSKI